MSRLKSRDESDKNMTEQVLNLKKTYVGIESGKEYQDIYYANSLRLSIICDRICKLTSEKYNIVKSTDTYIGTYFTSDTISDLMEQLNTDSFCVDNFDKLVEFIESCEYPINSSYNWILFKDGYPIVWSKSINLEYWTDNLIEIFPSKEEIDELRLQQGITK
jgi:hypothetical protein